MCGVGKYGGKNQEKKKKRKKAQTEKNGLRKIAGEWIRSGSDSSGMGKRGGVEAGNAHGLRFCVHNDREDVKKIEKKESVEPKQA